MRKRQKWDEIFIGRWLFTPPLGPHDYDQYSQQLYWKQLEAWPERLKTAVKNEWLTKNEAKALKNRLSALKENEQFRKELEDVNEETIEIFHNYYDTALIGEELVEWYKEKMRVLENFLDKYKIDGVNRGEPFVDVYAVRTLLKKDYSGRYIAVFEVPLWFPWDEFQKRARRHWQFLTRLSHIQKRYLRRKQGKQRKREINKRNVWIVKKFKELRKSGKTKNSCYEQIADELMFSNGEWFLTPRSVARIVRERS